jgi:hypothetical protein
MADEKRLEQQSRDNMVNFYQLELNQILEGQGAIQFLSDRVRKRLIEYGIITKKFGVGSGSTYFVTPLGEELLTELRAKTGEQKEEE